MRIVFMGTSPFAIPSLLALAQSPEHEVLAVTTQPDKPHGRSSKPQWSPVKVAAESLNLILLQPEKVRRPHFFETISNLAPDVLVVAAFGQIISQKMLDLPRYGGINVHGSLLPRWRGAAPMQYALMEGDHETGVTTMQMDAGMDTGDILLQAPLTLLDDDNLETVEAKLSQIGAGLLMKTLALISQGDCPRTTQRDDLVTLSPPLPSDIGRIDWTRPELTIHNLIRGVTPRPGAFTFFNGKRVKIHKSSMLPTVPESGYPEGTILEVSQAGITVKAGSGSITLTVVQPEGKPAMNAADWARGARLQPGISNFADE